jgi:alkaline phosphatase D
LSGGPASTDAVKIVAASCANLREVDPQPVWSEIRAERPDALVLLGDNVYLERDDHTAPTLLAAELRACYARQFADAHFAGLLGDLQTRGAPVIAVYDDHDFLGDNCCGGEATAALREAARAEFINAFAPVQTGADVYRMQRLGAVDLVALDTRFYRTTAAVSAGDPDAMLGRTQWSWFERALAASTAPYLVIASSTTLHAFGDQSWEQYPAAFTRLVRLLRGRVGALVLSGDAHRNATYDESGVIEIVTSAVAQRSRKFGTVRQNYGVLDFGAAAVQVELRSLKIGSRFAFEVPLARWTLP